MRLRARRRLTDFCNTNRRTGTIPSCRPSPCDRGQDPSGPAHDHAPPCESERAAREASIALPIRRGMTPPKSLRTSRRERKREGREASSEGCKRFGRRQSPPRLLTRAPTVMTRCARVDGNPRVRPSHQRSAFVRRPAKETAPLRTRVHSTFDESRSNARNHSRAPARGWLPFTPARAPFEAVAIASVEPAPF